MTSPPSRPPLQPGQFVVNRGDRRCSVGVVVGVLLTPFELALVRWSATESTVEPLDMLVEVLKLFG
jgi:hypothetical protein